VWSGNAANFNDRARSVPLATLLRHLPTAPGLRYYSLQKGPAAAQLTSGPLIDFAPRLTDFAETAAAIAKLDLVISVDTSVAHLAGALGARVWTLIPEPPEFRWMLDREDSPWYPTMRLFRQKRAGDWDEPMQRVADDLVRLHSSTGSRDDTN
jgi:ADP-heptose:LPS heptosyltransferase